MFRSSKQKICVFGLGEAGGLIGRDLAMLDMIVTAYDPKPVPTPAAIERFDDPVDAVAGVDVVIALTASADAETALRQAFEQIPSSALYADFSTASSESTKATRTRPPPCQGSTRCA